MKPAHLVVGVQQWDKDVLTQTAEKTTFRQFGEFVHRS